MIACEVKARRWGNSIGVTLPKEAVEKGKIKEDAKLMVLIVENRQVLRKTFGMMKGKLKKDSQRIKDELRADLYD